MRRKHAIPEQLVRRRSLNVLNKKLLLSDEQHGKDYNEITRHGHSLNVLKKKLLLSDEHGKNYNEITWARTTLQSAVFVILNRFSARRTWNYSRVLCCLDCLGRLSSAKLLVFAFWFYQNICSLSVGITDYEITVVMNYCVRQILCDLIKRNSLFSAPRLVRLVVKILWSWLEIWAHS